MYTIYALLDPRTSKIKHINWTSRPGTATLISNTRLKSMTNSWISELQALGLRPVLQILQSTECWIETQKLVANLTEGIGVENLESVLFVRVHNKNQSKLDPEVVRRLYLQERKTLAEIRTELKCSGELLRKHLITHNIERRAGHTYHRRHDYFKVIDTAEKAYILGLIATDGCISGNTILLQLQIGDEEILREVARWFEYTGPLRYQKKMAPVSKLMNDYVTLSITSKETCQDLARHGIGPRKTKTLLPPSTIPPELLSHYLRGAYDGDGSIIIKDSKAGLLFCCASEPYIKWIHTHFEGVAKAKVSPYLCSDKVWRLDYGSFPHVKDNSVLALLDYLYKDATIYLDRKYEKYQEVVKLSKVPHLSYKEKQQATFGMKIQRSDGKIYSSISDAARDMGSRVANIQVALRNPRRSCKGFKWTKL